MSSRILVPAFAVLLFANPLFAQVSVRIAVPAIEEPPQPASRRWMKLSDAMAEAQVKGRLILLDQRSAFADPAGDRWRADAEAFPAVARAMDQMLLGVAVAHAGFGKISEFKPYGVQQQQLIVLDPWGGVVLELNDGFGDFARLAYALNALQRQAPTFIRAAIARREGKVAQSLVFLAWGLLDARATEVAGVNFRQAYSMAKSDNDADTMQNAQLGLIAIDLPSQRPNALSQATKTLEEIAAHPVTTEIASRAWMMLAYVHSESREEKQAIDAYQKSFAAAPKPSALAEAARRHLETLGSEPESELRAEVVAGNVHLLYPHREVMVGKVVFGIATSNDVTRVEVFLDDARIAELTRPPFSAKVNLGMTPHVRTVRAVAFDAQERRLGEDRVTLNDRAVSLGVNIVAPVSNKVTSRTTVEVQPRIPEGVRLAGVDLYWNETKIATLSAEPFRHELVLPSPSASGFIRAVVRTDDGATAEDVKMINAGGVSEQLRVDAVQVYAIVQDRSGHYIDGLKASDFVVKEDGRVVTSRVQSASDDPISIGMALDTSGSMLVSMMAVIDYASEFVLYSLGATDQTFIVAFDEQPRLVQPLTRNRRQLTDAIYDMQASGGTAIWDAVLFSLQQFHDVPGKRALVVFTDGINNAGAATPKADLQYAREVGVPIYVVQIFTGINQELMFTEGNIRLLTESTGGAFFRFAGKNDLPRLFSQIRDDTRGPPADLRIARHETERRDAADQRGGSGQAPGKPVVVRATSGYYP